MVGGAEQTQSLRGRRLARRGPGPTCTPSCGLFRVASGASREGARHDDGEDDDDAWAYPSGPGDLHEPPSVDYIHALADLLAHHPRAVGPFSSVGPSWLRLENYPPPPPATPPAPPRSEAYSRRTSTLIGAGHSVLVYNQSPANRGREEEEELDDEEGARRKAPGLWRRFASLFGW